MTDALPLTGLKVVAVEQAVAAPYCSMRLADAGAEVIKIERPEGDFARGYDKAAAGQSSYFVWLNRGKTSKVINLATDTGRAALEELIAGADVLIQNLRHGAMERLGFAPDRLRKDYPSLITCSISGYGETGPYANRKAYDLLIQAESGLCSITGGPSEPSRVGVSVVDIATGAAAHAAILEALIGRAISGMGAAITVSMFDVMAEWLTVPLLNHEAGNTPRRVGMAHPSIAPYGVFKTRDGEDVLISIQSDREWRNLCREFLKRPELVEDPDFATNVARVSNRDQTDRAVAEGFLTVDSTQVSASLTRADIAFAFVSDMEKLSKHPHLRRIMVETPNGPVSLPAPGPVFDGVVRNPERVPMIGETVSAGLNKQD